MGNNYVFGLAYGVNVDTKYGWYNWQKDGLIDTSKPIVPKLVYDL